MCEKPSRSKKYSPWFGDLYPIFFFQNKEFLCFDFGIWPVNIDKYSTAGISRSQNSKYKLTDGASERAHLRETNEIEKNLPWFGTPPSPKVSLTVRIIFECLLSDKECIGFDDGL